MTDLEKFKEFFKQFGITLEPAVYNKGAYQLDGASVTKHHADADFVFNEDGSFKEITIEY